MQTRSNNSTVLEDLCTKQDTVKNIQVILEELSVGQAARQYFFTCTILTGNFLISC